MIHYVYFSAVMPPSTHDSLLTTIRGLLDGAPASLFEIVSMGKDTLQEVRKVCTYWASGDATRDRKSVV